MTAPNLKAIQTLRERADMEQGRIVRRSVSRLSGACIAAIAASLFFSAAGHAEEGEGPDDIVVTGQHNIVGSFAGASAISVKEASPGVVDSVGPELLGLVPDLSLVEAATRIVGVSGESSLDRFTGLTIRGFASTNNLATVDGVPLATVSQSARGDPSLIFPTSLVSRIDVFKTFSADRDPHGLGGQVNYITKSAFDYNKRSFLFIDGAGGLNTESGNALEPRKPSFRASVTGGYRFGTDDQFGLIFNAEYQRLATTTRNEVDQGLTYYTADGKTTPYAGLSGYGESLANTNISNYGADLERQRAGASLKLEYRGDKLRLSALGGYYDYKSVQDSAYTHVFSRGNLLELTPTSALFSQGQINQSALLQSTSYRTKLGMIKGQYDFDDNLKINVIGSYSATSSRVNSIISNWSRGASKNGKLAYTIKDGYFKAIFPDLDSVNDISTYTQENSYIQPKDLQKTDTDVMYGKAELAYNADRGDAGFGFNLGGAITRSTLEYDRIWERYRIKDIAASEGIVSGLLYPGTIPAVVAPGVNQYRVNPGKVADWLYTNMALFDPDGSMTASNLADDFSETETITALYAQAMWQSDRLLLQGGFRYDRTSIDVNVQQPATGPNAVLAYEPAPTRHGKYDFFLPSALVVYKFNDQARLRAAFSKTIGRPSYSNYAARTTYSVGLNAETGEDRLTVNKGNENLKPLETLNYDLSFEWYSPTWGAFAVAAFYKDERNLIYTRQEIVDQFDYNGVLYDDVRINQPVNAEKGKVKGVEISYTNNELPFMPGVLRGLGVIANFTYMEGTYNLPMSAAAIAQGEPEVRKTWGQINQPRYIANFALTYQRGPFNGLVSFQRTGQKLNSANSTATMLDNYYQPRNQVDVSVKYDVTPWATLWAQGQNITNSSFEIWQGPDQKYLYNTAISGANYWLGMSLKF